MRKRLIIFTAALTLLCAPGWAQKKKGNVLDIKESITDNSIIYPESFETDTQALLEGWYMKNYTATDDRYRTSPDAAVTDEVLIERLKNIPSVIEMPYNQIVKKYIERYTKNGRSLVTACLGLGNYYLPIIEQALEAEGLPNELKYLPMIESAFNPNAVSRAGATGLWQFMLAAAKGYDMEVSSLVDERRDPYESSKKGAKLLKDLYNTYGKWDLAIAAYNCGPGNVNKAIRRAGGDPKQHDFWSIYNYLPSETRGYFPMFVAANYIMNYYQDHNISPVVPTKPLVTDTVGISSRINLNHISKVLDIPLDELRLLNPQFRSDVIPGSAKRQYMLILPSRQVAAYIMSEDEIKGYDAQKYARRVVADPGSLPKETDIDTEVSQSFSESDNLVAQQPEGTGTDADYRMVREASRQIEEERKQEAEAAATTAAAAEATASSASRANRPSSTVNSAGQTVHKVASGESLQSIAELYRVSPDQLKIWNNLKRNSVRVGQQLVIKGGVTPQSNNRQVATYDADDAPAQAAPAKAAAPARSRSNSKAQATQASNAKASQKQQQNTAATAQSGSKKTSKSKSKSTTAEQQTATASKSSKKSKNKAAEQTAQQQTTKKGKKGKKQAEETTTASKSSKKDRNNNKKSKKSKKTEPAKPTTHDVKKGESLDKIARQHGVSVDDLKKANKNIKGNTIHPGDDLNIPKSKSSKSSAKSSKKDKNNSKSSKKSSAKESKKSTSKSSSKSSSKKSDTKKKKKK